MSDTPRKEEDKHTEIANDLYCAIGYALTQWGTVEEALCSIYILATTFPATGATQPASGAAFWAIATFDGKLKMTDAAVAIRIAGSDDLKRKWRALFNNMGFKNKRRNDLAHGTVATYWDDEGQGQTYFAASHYRHMYTLDHKIAGIDDVLPEKRLSPRDVEQRAEGFATLSKRLREFRVCFFDYLSQLQASRPQGPEAAPRFRIEANHSPAESQPPEKPSRG